MATKTISVKNDNFYLMTSGAKIIGLRSNLIEKLYRGMKRVLQCFFEFFLAIILLEIIMIVCGKSLFSQNLKFGDLW